MITPTGTFPTGLWPQIEEVLIDERFPYEVIDERSQKCDLLLGHVPQGLLQATPTDRGAYEKEGKWYLTFEPHQEQAILTAIYKKRGVFFGSVGSGKTEIAAGIFKILHWWYNAPIQVFMTHKTKLAKDTRKRLAIRMGVENEDIGFIGNGVWEDGTTNIYVIMVTTAVQKKFGPAINMLLADAWTMIIDEAHHTAASTWYKVVQKCDAPIRIGLSATPLHRNDQKDMKLIGATGPVVFELSMADAMDKGIITPIKFLPTTIRKTSEPILSTDAWPDVYAKAIVNNQHYHEKVVQNVRKDVRKGRSVLVLVRHLAHGSQLLDLLDLTEVRAEMIRGEQTKTGQRRNDEIVRKLELGVIKCMIATTVVGEGIDIPAVDVVHLCDSEKSVISVIQKIGRGVRTKKGKKYCYLRDYAHLTHAKLEAQAAQRRRIYKEWDLLGH